MSANHDAILEDIQYLRDVFPSDQIFNELVAEGARGDEVHRIDGDDLAGACHALNDLAERLGYEFR